MLRGRIKRLLQVQRSLSRPFMPTIATSSQTAPGPMEESIRNKITSQLHPSELIITNDSWQHRHHAAMRAQGSENGETHFSIQVVSEAFKGKTTLQRHRMIHATLSEELSLGLHALSLNTRTIEESRTVRS